MQLHRLLPLFALSGCLSHQEPGDEIGPSSQALMGGVKFDSNCAPYQDALADMLRYARAVATTAAFEECLELMITEGEGGIGPYEPWPGDPYAEDDLETQLEAAIALTTSPNLVIMNCAGTGGSKSSAAYVSCEDVFDYDDEGGELFYWKASWISQQTQLSSEYVPPCVIEPWNPECQDSASMTALSTAAGLTWHEAFHNHGYRHDEDTKAPNYPNRMNNLIQACMVWTFSQGNGCRHVANQCAWNEFAVVDNYFSFADDSFTSGCVCAADPFLNAGAESFGSVLSADLRIDGASLARTLTGLDGTVTLTNDTPIDINGEIEVVTSTGEIVILDSPTFSLAAGSTADLSLAAAAVAQVDTADQATVSVGIQGSDGSLRLVPNDADGTMEITDSEEVSIDLPNLAVSVAAPTVLPFASTHFPIITTVENVGTAVAPWAELVVLATRSYGDQDVTIAHHTTFTSPLLPGMSDDFAHTIPVPSAVVAESCGSSVLPYHEIDIEATIVPGYEEGGPALNTAIAHVILTDNQPPSSDVSIHSLVRGLYDPSIGLAVHEVCPGDVVEFGVYGQLADVDSNEVTFTLSSTLLGVSFEPNTGATTTARALGGRPEVNSIGSLYVSTMPSLFAGSPHIEIVELDVRLSANDCILENSSIASRLIALRRANYCESIVVQTLDDLFPVEANPVFTGDAHTPISATPLDRSLQPAE